MGYSSRGTEGKRRGRLLTFDWSIRNTRYILIGSHRPAETLMGEETRRTAEIEVESYAGFRAEESPRNFSLGQRRIKVLEVIDRWLEPTHSYFKVRGDDAGIYILRYKRDSDVWEMILFDSGTRAETRLSST